MENRNLTYYSFFGIIIVRLEYIINKERNEEVDMKKYLFFLMLLFTVTFSAYSAKILVWLFDPSNYDIYQDSEAGQQIRCDYWIKKSLDANGYTYETHSNTSLPSDIISYDVILGTIGYHTC